MYISSNITRLIAAIALSLGGIASAKDAVVTIDASAAGPRVNPRMYGVFLEEINHGVDGGLYAELIRNRGFEDGRPPEGYELRGGRWLDANGFPAGVDEFGYKIGGLPFWSLVRTSDAKGALHLEMSGGITKESEYCLRLEVEESGWRANRRRQRGLLRHRCARGRDVSAVALCAERRSV